MRLRGKCTGESFVSDVMALQSTRNARQFRHFEAGRAFCRNFEAIRNEDDTFGVTVDIVPVEEVASGIVDVETGEVWQIYPEQDWKVLSSFIQIPEARR